MRQLGRYVAHHALGRGGTATVYFGTLMGPSGFVRRVAIKELHAIILADPELRSMLTEEARISGRIMHPNTVPIVDVVEQDGQAFAVMDYVHGATAFELLREARSRRGTGSWASIFPYGVAVAIGADVLSGLAAAHAARDISGRQLGVIHRDISPDNVLVGMDGVARLTDFGIARAEGRSVQTESGVVKGKFRYMAPEQAAGEATQASDLFSMGVLLFELLTGMRLFDADHEAGVLNQVLSKKIPAPTSVDPHVPQTLSDVILRATDRDPNRRFPSAAAMGEEWRAAFHRNDQEQVQRFVRGLLGDSLQAKLTLVEEAERTSSANAERTIHVAPPAPAASEAWEDAPTVEDAPKEMSPPRPRTIEAVLPSPRTSSPPAMMAHSEVTDPTHVAFETEVAAMRRRPSRRTLAMVLAGVGLLVALFIGAQLSGPTEPLRTGSPPSASPTVSLAPSPSAVISPTPTAATSSKGPAVADRSASTAVASSSAAPVVPHPLGKGAPDCRTPFYIDKDGVRVYRRECL